MAKYTFETDDEAAMKRVLKAADMEFFIHDLTELIYGIDKLNMTNYEQEAVEKFSKIILDLKQSRNL